MFVGGIAAIMVQMLHPLAMAGVADHSNWVADPIKRLSRTASFITATTFASTPVAEDIIEQVRRRHARVSGTAFDGRPYHAEDPGLLRWVHTAQASSFLAAHLRYHPDPISPTEQDRYFRDLAGLAERLGATDVPNGRDEVAEYFRVMQQQLCLGPQGRDALHVLQNLRLNHGVQTSLYRLFLEAAGNLIPAWAQSQLDFKGSRRARVLSPLALSLLRRVRKTPEWLEEARIRCRS